MDASNRRGLLSIFRRHSTSHHQPFHDDHNDDDDEPKRPTRRRSSRRMSRQQQHVSDMDTSRHSSREVLDGSRTSNGSQFVIPDEISERNMTEQAWNQASHGGSDILSGMEPETTTSTTGTVDEPEEDEAPQKLFQVEWKLAPNGKYESLVVSENCPIDTGASSPTGDGLVSLDDGSLGSAGTGESLCVIQDVRKSENALSDESLVGRLTVMTNEDASIVASREFYLPKLMATGGEQEEDDRSLQGEDPLALDSILRPWQVDFLQSVHIKTAKDLVEARKAGIVGLLAKDMRKWRKKEKLPSFRTKSCGVALRIWARACRSVVRSVKKQQKRGVPLIIKPVLLEDKSSFGRSFSTGTRATEASTSSGVSATRTSTAMDSPGIQADSASHCNRQVLTNLQSSVTSMIQQSNERSDKRGGHMGSNDGSKNQPHTLTENAIIGQDPGKQEAMTRSSSSSSLRKRSRAAKPARFLSARSLTDSFHRGRRHRGNQLDDLLEIHRTRSTPALDSPRKSCLRKPPWSDELSVKSKNSLVKFSEVQFREYERVLGDNPSVTDGPPIAIGWKYSNEVNFSVDSYESSRPPRRVKQEFLMPARLRRELLLEENAIPYSQLRRVMSESDMVKAKRNRLAHKPLAIEKAEELMESSRRRLRRLRSGTSKAEEQEQLWDDAREWFEQKEAAAEIKHKSSSSFVRYNSNVSQD